MSPSAPVGLPQIEVARRAVDTVAVRTPIFNSRMLSAQFGTTIVMKAENLQRTGSFKVRGVAAKLAALGGRAEKGIVAASAGNHAQAVAFGASQVGVKCHIFMPAEAPVAKVEATQAYGATTELGGASVDDCLSAAEARAASTGETYIHPFDDPYIIAGQGTLGLEILEQVPDLSLVLVPLGGGGLISGMAIALKALRPDVRVVGVQARVCAPFAAKLGTGATPLNGAPNSLADGIAVKQPVESTLSIIETHVDDVVTVAEDDIADAMVLLLERAKLVVEGAGAVGVAALLGHAVELPDQGTTVLLLSGGNVDPNLLATAIRRRETNAGRRLAVFARISDRPGELGGLLTVIGSAGGNVIDVVHLREGYDLHVRETGVHLVLETRGPAHADAVLEAVHRAGYEVRPVNG